jgi:hypothetical protein
MNDLPGMPTGPSRPEQRAGGAITPRPASAPSRAEQERALLERNTPQRRESGAPRNPFDLETAFARLKTLLAFDGPNGPRNNVPRRGFYLNILS